MFYFEGFFFDHIYVAVAGKNTKPDLFNTDSNSTTGSFDILMT